MVMVEQDEAELVHKGIAGDKLAFAKLVMRYRSFVIGLAYRLCGDPPLAEDIAQDVFVRAWQALPGFRQQAAFRTWLYRIASNVAIEQLRHARPTVDIDDTALTTQDTPENQVLCAEQCHVVRQAVLRLPLQSRLALILREYEGLSYQEIASALDVPMGTVMSRLNYARQRLGQELAQYIRSSAAEE